jgi:hypothetical protein
MHAAARALCAARAPGGGAARFIGSISRAARPGGFRFPRLPAARAGAGADAADAAIAATMAAAGARGGAPAAAGGGAEASALVPAGAAAAPAPADAAAGAAAHPAARVLADLAAAGRVARETLAVVEASGEWRDYEAHVNFELNHLRVRYAATPDAPATAARRAQLAAHVRAKQAAVMEEHADEAARAFVESLTPREVADLRARVARLDAPGSGAGARAAADARNEKRAGVAVSAEQLRDALWAVSTELAKATRK